jgi:hypothetical protein
MLLEQTAGKGIFVYTHGEMLPCHGYPELKKHPHFYGHYGTAWQNQQKEFAAFPGAILMTTNCIQKPAPNYQANIFTTGLVGWPGVAHIDTRPDGTKDFTPVIQKALELPGFTADEDKGSVMVGFARNAVLSVADKVIDGVKKGAIRHFFLVAGCDGAKPGRNYYTEFVEKVPQDCVVLTLACGKFRFFDKNLGDIGGIPRLLDVGQCNDAYSAIQIAVALANAFGCGVNDLPLSMVLSWYEQKAVAILLTLLSLGIKGIRLGPSLPAFVSPAVLDTLVKTSRPFSASHETPAAHAAGHCEPFARLLRGGRAFMSLQAGTADCRRRPPKADASIFGCGRRSWPRTGPRPHRRAWLPPRNGRTLRTRIPPPTPSPAGLREKTHGGSPKSPLPAACARPHSAPRQDPFPARALRIPHRQIAPPDHMAASRS